MTTPHNGRDALRALLLIFLIPVFCASNGCVWYGFAGEVEDRPYTDRIVLSSDGRQAAYVWTDRCVSLIPWPPRMPIDRLSEAKTEWLGWCTPDGTNHLVRIDAQSRVLRTFGNSRSIRGIAFSPDGRHLAAVLEDRIAIIDTGTGEVRQLTCPRGKFTSARWFDDAQLAYATTSPAEEPRVVVRSVYRQGIDNGKPTRVFSRTSRRSGYAAFRESWAPDGRTVLLAEGPELWRLDLADGASDVLVRVSTVNASWVIHWRPGGQQVSVLTADSTKARLLLVGVVDCQSWRFTDHKRAFYRDVASKWARPISWTPDGFLLVRSSKSGRWPISLVQHSPWQVIDFVARYGKKIPRNANGRRAVQHLMPGWLAIGPGEKDSMTCAVDYDGKRQSPLTKHPFKVSGDGRRLAEVTRKGKITIRALELPGK